jgi:hypothetical protein
MTSLTVTRIARRESARPLKVELAELRDFFWSAPDEALLDRKTVAAGLNRSVSWLEHFVTHGGGPEYLKVGPHRVLYRKGTVVRWFEQYSTKMSSSSVGAAA